MARMIHGGKMALSATALLLGVAPAASAHLERPSYWPDPAPDTSVNPPAGGGVPKARSLSSAVTGAGPGEVRVVCRGKSSLRLALQSISQARSRGFQIRPSQPTVRYSKKEARKMERLNRSLYGMCKYGEIQAAINDSGNNDRIVIMPGRYVEPQARTKPLNDPACNPGLLQKDASGSETPSYAYQVNCPHDQNLLYVQGRALVGTPLAEPRSNRQGIPQQELGQCVRCNLQIEGSGPKPTDVILDAGSAYGSRDPEAKPRHQLKHVVLRVDRGDGFVGRNFTVRGAREFGFYAEETDGVLLDRTKFFWNADYGHLSFTTDHHVVQNCDGFGSGDSVVYPGAAPETGSQATSFYPDAPRYNTVITQCDLRGSALGYSGSMGNAVRITENHIYGNMTGIASDTLSSAGHPGFPADSPKVDHNFIYSNNLNLYGRDAAFRPLISPPVGTGIIYPGINDARVHDNWFFDNWRDGAMLLAVPDAITSNEGPEGDVYPGVSCEGAPANGISTSCGNHFFNNQMGRVPPGFRFPTALGQFNAVHSPNSAQVQPNGNDFWWDEFASNRWNCWYGNTGADGTSRVTGSGNAGRSPGVPPNPLPDCAGGSNQDMSRGNGDPAKEAYLVDCGEGPDQDTSPLACDWWVTPARPGSAAARRRSREFARAAARFALTQEGLRMRARIEKLAGGG
jgi:hypothetical protein